MVLYRKYRPQSLDDLIGQEAVKKALLSAFSAQKLAHAYLFCGPRGTGKTSTARILAKMVNCELAKSLPSLQSKEATVANEAKIPCNQCSSCLTITDGSHMDLVEVDAASNRGIDDVRSLKETIKLAPTSAKKKVYIIDEVHMLSNEAFNALLKTLEEPPAHALFILATTELQKIPATILSRVQKLEFKLATTEDMVQALKKVAEGEKITIDHEGLLILAKKAGGSFRDGVKLLDQLSSLEKIDGKIALENLGSGDYDQLVELAGKLAKKDTKGALELLAAELQKGVSAKELNLSSMDLFRQLLLIKNGMGESLVKAEVGEGYSQLEALAKTLETAALLHLLECFQKALESSRYVSIASLPLEVAIIESCQNRETRNESKVIGAPKVIEESNESNVKVPLAPLKSDSSQALLTQSEALDSFDSSDTDINKIHDRWTYILETVRQHNYSLEALLRTSKIVECSEKDVVFEVPYSFHQRIMEAPKSREMLEALLADILSRSVKISTILGKRPVSREELANVEVAEEDETIRMVAEIFSSDSPN